MDYKKKYEQAIENFKKIKEANKDNNELVDFIEYEYPELKESEDEKTRKALLKNLTERFGTKGTMGNNLEMPKVISWLEKQGEQKPAWSEECAWKLSDEQMKALWDSIPENV